MTKLILDAAAMELAKRKLKSTPIFAGPSGAFLEPGIVELGVAEGDEEARWQPRDSRTSLLALAGEACRDVEHHANAVLAAPVLERGRALRAMTVPACTLMDVTRQLLAALNGPEQRTMRSKWPQGDQLAYRDAVRRLKKLVTGPVREARNKLGAHLDTAAYALRVVVNLDDVLEVLRESLLLLLLALNHDSRSFSWIRPLGQSEDGTRCVVETMFSYPVAARWLTDADGRVLDVG
ncbi:MAG TPA: hypothetical protein VNG33_03420, partial [Polyangiaceae bacterium]|nr:hypothetical protein [Polyangiaceae bacterium]